MTNPGQSIELDDEVALAAATELLDVATRIEEMISKFKDVAAAFEADARLDGDVLPASKATLDFLTQASLKVSTSLTDAVGRVEKIGDAINGRVAEQGASDDASVAEVGAVDGGTPR